MTKPNICKMFSSNEATHVVSISDFRSRGSSCAILESVNDGIRRSCPVPYPDRTTSTRSGPR